MIYTLRLSLGLTGLLLVAGLAGAQEPPPSSPPPEQTPEAEAEAESESAGGPSQADLDLIENLLEEGEEVLEGGLAYDPGTRRDPFRSLLVVVEAIRHEGPRPEGIPGLLIDEITLSGVWIWSDGPVVQVQSANDPVSYLLRPGDKLFDGEVLSVNYSRESGGEVVFRQMVDDPTAPKPFREIVRRLEP